MAVTVFKYIASLLTLIILTGCFTESRQEQRDTKRVEEKVGIEAGQPTQLTTTTTEQQVDNSQIQAGVDVSKALTAGLAAIRGDIIGVLKEFKQAQVAPAAISEPSGINGTTGGIIGTVGLLALREFMARRKADQDAKDAHELKDQAHAREVALAKQLPPTPGA